jgi:hypothetical protein
VGCGWLWLVVVGWWFDRGVRGNHHHSLLADR